MGCHVVHIILQDKHVTPNSMKIFYQWINVPVPATADMFVKSTMFSNFP